MAQRISDATLSLLSSFVAREMGLLFPRERWGDLERGMAAAAGSFGFRDPEECALRLASAPLTRPQVEILAGFLTVGESYFFRDPGAFKVAESSILPPLIASRRDGERSIRVWSAGCSSGEEPYSIAILLHRLLPDLENWKVTILATDIKPAALRQAMTGIYGKWSFRGTPSWLRPLYFTPAGEGRFLLAERVRRMVSFAYLNLAEDSYPSLFTNTSAMDLIFCRNVLMYFTKEMVQRVVAKLHQSLVEGGWLVVGPVEYWPESYHQFEAVSFDALTCYRKRGASAPPLEGESPVAAGPPTEPAEPGPQRRELPPPLPAGAEPNRQGLNQQVSSLLAGLSAGAEVQPEAAAMQIRSQANRGKLSEALALCDLALERHKLDPSLHLLRAEILQERGAPEEARLSLERALYLDPKLVLAHFALGNLALRGGKLQKARKHFQNALALAGAFSPEEILPGSEGMTAGRLCEMIRQITSLAGKVEDNGGAP